MPYQEDASDAVRTATELLRMQQLLPGLSPDQANQFLALRRIAMQRPTPNEQEALTLPDHIEGQVQSALETHHVDPFFRVTGSLQVLEKTITQGLRQGSIPSNGHQLQYPFSCRIIETDTPAAGEISIDYKLERHPFNPAMLSAHIRSVQYLVRANGADTYTEGAWITPDRDKNNIVQAVDLLPLRSGKPIHMTQDTDIDRISRVADHASWILQTASYLAQRGNDRNNHRQTA